MYLIRGGYTWMLESNTGSLLLLKKWMNEFFYAFYARSYPLIVES